MPSDLDTLIADVLAKHAAGITPLPWCEGSNFWWDIESEMDEPVCQVCLDEKVSNQKLARANCKFIVAAANAAPVLANRLKLALEALKPFAAMDRIGGLLDHVVLERGAGSDKTILTESDFRRAAAALTPEVSDDQR